MNDRRIIRIRKCQLKCERCEHTLSRVTRTKNTAGFVLRERQCAICGHVNVTSERVIPTLQDPRYFSSGD